MSKLNILSCYDLIISQNRFLIYIYELSQKEENYRVENFRLFL